MLRRLTVIGVATAAIVALIVWYVTGYLMVSSASVSVPSANLTLQTVAGLGNGYTEPTWVSYLVKDENGDLAAQHRVHSCPRTRSST